MPEIKFRISQSDLDLLTAQAAAVGITRAELIRRRVLKCDSTMVSLTPGAYHALVADAAAFMRGDLYRHHVETLVAYVIRRLGEHQPETIAGDHSPA